MRKCTHLRESVCRGKKTQSPPLISTFVSPPTQSRRLKSFRSFKSLKARLCMRLIKSILTSCLVILESHFPDRLHFYVVPVSTLPAKAERHSEVKCIEARSNPNCGAPSSLLHRSIPSPPLSFSSSVSAIRGHVQMTSVLRGGGGPKSRKFCGRT